MDASILPLDFVSLPIIVTDWDALVESKKHDQVPTAEIERSQTVSKIKPTDDQREDKQQELGITESVEEIWSRISDAMKTKLREACVEVLRRTDDTTTSRDDENSFDYDNDARFLD